MSVAHDVPMADYHAIPAVSASLLWDIVRPEGCLAQARYNSSWLNPGHKEEPNEDLEFGTVVHLAVLEPEAVADRITVIDAPDYRTKEARQLREEARAFGRVPILAQRTKGVSLKAIETIRAALEASEAASLLFDPGVSEVTYTWNIGGLPCKARADRVTAITRWALVDLKTAPSASPEAFQRAMIRDGHHLRAAFYLAGWHEQQPEASDHRWEYVFVQVAKEPPHLASVFRLDDRAMDWGRRLMLKALADFRRAQDTGHWPSFMHEPIETVGLPTFAEYRLADLEAAGQL